MNSVEMTNNPSKNDDVSIPTSSESLPQEFVFHSSKNMKLTNHLRRFKFFGGVVMAIVMLVLLATVHSSAGLKAARANAPASDLVLNTKTAPTISLWSQEAEDEVVAASTTLLTVVDGSNYAPIWRSIVTRTNRFAVFRRSAVNAGKIDVVLGSWNSIISDFQSQFPTTGEAVGFFVLGDKSITSLYEVVYLPSTSNLTASQVLISYGLPVNPKILNAPGLPIANTLVVRNLRDITTTNFIMNAKAAGTVSLWWGDEDVPSEEETNEVTVVPDSSASLIYAADGSPYYAVWNSLVARTNRFAVFRRSATNPQKLDVRLGGWSSTLLDFQSQFPTSESAVGFYILGDKTATALYEVVFHHPASQFTASQILAYFALPANPRLLNAPGLPVANTLVVKSLSDITTTNLVLNAKAAGTVSLWWGDEDVPSEEESNEVTVVPDSSANLLAVADGSAYAYVWNSLVDRTNRFVVFVRDLSTGKPDVRLGDWRSSTIYDFKSQFPYSNIAVGFYIMEDEYGTELYEVVLNPWGSELTASQVLASFALPANPRLLNAPGLPIANTIVVKSGSDISTINLMLNAKAAGTVSLWWGKEEESESSDDAEEEVETAASEAGSEVADSSAALLAVADGSAYASVWKTLVARTNRFAVFRRNAVNPSKLDVRVGSWNALVSDFQSQFPANEESVGFFILGDKTAIALYEVVFLPSTSRLNASQVLAGYGLPANPKLLNAPGLPVANTLVVRNLKDITTTNFIMNAKAAGTVSLWWGDEDVPSEEETNEVTVVPDSSASLIYVADGSPYYAVWNSLVARTNRFAVFRRSVTNPQKLDVRLGGWSSTLLDFQSQFPTYESAVGFYILGDKNATALYEVVFRHPASQFTASQILAYFALPANPRLLNAPGLPVANTLVVKSLSDITTTNFIMNAKAAGTVSLWWGEESESSDDDAEEGETAETAESGVQSLWGWSSSSSTTIASDGSAYEDVWAALKAKTNRFVVFRQNAANSKLIDVDSGNWDAIFSQFSSLFQATKPQVGYIWLGTPNHEQLYEIVYCPTALRTNPATVMVNFGLPPNPNVLVNSYGLALPNTFVATEKKQVDTGNIIMKAVSGGIIP